MSTDGRSFRERYGDIFDPYGQRDATYRAWEQCQQGSVMNLKLVPAYATGEPVRQIPYLQPITIEHHRDTDQLCLMCHSTGMIVFLEGRGLEALADLIAEKRVKAINMFDDEQWPALDNEAAVVTAIRVEQS